METLAPNAVMQVHAAIGAGDAPIRAHRNVDDYLTLTPSHRK